MRTANNFATIGREAQPIYSAHFKHSSCIMCSSSAATMHIGFEPAISILVALASFAAGFSRRPMNPSVWHIAARTVAGVLADTAGKYQRIHALPPWRQGCLLLR